MTFGAAVLVGAAGVALILGASWSALRMTRDHPRAQGMARGVIVRVAFLAFVGAVLVGAIAVWSSIRSHR